MGTTLFALLLLASTNANAKRLGPPAANLCAAATDALTMRGLATERVPADPTHRPQIIVDAMKTHVARLEPITGKPYSSLTAPLDGEAHVIGDPKVDARVRASSIWVPEPGSPTQAIWPMLSGPEQVELAKQIEKVFVGGRFGYEIFRRYASDGTYEGVMGFYNLKPQSADSSDPAFQLPEEALIQSSIPVGFSGTRFFKAAVENQPHGICQQIACAQASLLNSLGAPNTAVTLLWGKSVRNDGAVAPLNHFYLAIRPKGSPTWVPIDGVADQWRLVETLKKWREEGMAGLGHWYESFPKGAGQDPFFLSPQYVSKPLNPTPEYPERPRILMTRPSNNSANRGNTGNQIYLGYPGGN